MLQVIDYVHACVVEEGSDGRVGFPVVGDVALTAHGDGEGGCLEEDGQELGLELLWGGGRQEGGEEFNGGGVKSGEGVVEVWGWRGGVGEEGEDPVGAASLAVEAWWVRVSFGHSGGAMQKKERGTIAIDQLHIQLPQLPQLILVGAKQLLPKHYSMISALVLLV